MSDGHDTWNIVAWRVEAGGGVLILVCGEGSCAADSLPAFNSQRLDEILDVAQYLVEISVHRFLNGDLGILGSAWVVGN